LSRIFQLFRTMGLRHLTIVNTHNQVGHRFANCRALTLGRRRALPHVTIQQSSIRRSSPHHIYSLDLFTQLVGMVTRKDLANITNDMKREDFLFSSRIANDTVKYVMPEDFAPARALLVE
jgi:hypothetical protein